MITKQMEQLIADYDTTAKTIPQLMELKDVPQDPIWHPEGDVFAHTREVFFAMVDICNRDGIVDRAREIHLLTALGHDMGKPECTHLKQFEDGTERWVSPRHDVMTSRLSMFLASLNVDEEMKAAVITLTRLHMRHISFKHNGSSPKSLRKMVRQLASYKGVETGMTVYDLGRVVEADVSGRPPLPQHKSASMEYAIERIEEMAEAKEVGHAGFKINGRFLTVEMGMKPLARL